MSKVDYAQFWAWFQKNEDSLYSLDALRSQSELLSELGEVLQQTNENFSFEIGPIHDDKRELVLSANGIREAFPELEELAEQSPSLARWNIVSFRQRKALAEGELSIGSLNIRPQDIFCSLREELRRITITLHIKDFSEENYYDWMSAAFVLLDHSIGEFDVATKVGEVHIESAEPEDGDESFSLLELPDRFDTVVEELRSKLELHNSLPKEERRELLLSRLLEDNPQRILDFKKESQGGEHLVCFELYFRPLEPDSTTQLQAFLNKEKELCVERIAMGSVEGGECEWICCTFERKTSALRSFDELIRLYAEKGFNCNLELEEVFLSPVVENMSLTELLSGMDLSVESITAMDAQGLIESGKLNEAISTLKSALEDCPEDFEMRGLLGYAYAKLGKVEQALQILEELREEMENDSEHPATLWNTACAYALLNKSEAACKQLRLAFALNPDFREHAMSDPDLSSIRKSPEYEELMGIQ